MILVISLILVILSCSDEEKERPIIQIFTTEIDFGDNFIGTTSQARSFEITNKSADIILEIKEFRFEDPDYFSVSNINTVPFEIEGGQTQIVQVVFEPDNAGDCNALLRVISNADNDFNFAILFFVYPAKLLEGSPLRP